MKHVKIDRAKRLRDDAKTGHNRWHPDIPPAIETAPGEVVRLETRDASDGQIRPGMTVADLDSLDTKVAHPITGPVHVTGAKPGDLLEVEFVDIIPESHGWTRIRAGAGFLRDDFHDPFLAHWTLADSWARSAEIPGIRIPEASFMGTAGVAPSHAQLAEWTAREAAAAMRGDLVQPPDSQDAVPTTGPVATHGLRTVPPRENGGNLDIRHLTKGARLFLPVAVEGALFSTGDAHYAQGDSECCVTAIEMGATVDLRFKIHKGRAKAEDIRWPRFAHTNFVDAAWRGGGFVATTGMPVEQDGSNRGEDTTLAARNALRAMIDLLAYRGWSREQAYAICSVAADLRISSNVNAPNTVVSCLIPNAIFET